MYSGYSDKNNTDIGHNKGNGYGGVVFFRLYKNIGKDFFIFGQTGLSYIRSTSNSNDSSGIQFYQSIINGVYLNAFPGIAYKVSKKVSLELTVPNLLTVSYTSQTANGVPGSIPTKTSVFNIGANLASNPLQSLGIGLSFTI